MDSIRHRLLLQCPAVLSTLRLNCEWNPLILLGKRLVERALSDTGIFMNKAKGLRWLEEQEHNGEHIALASYPRCGNSLLRHLLESLTGVYTGCDTNPTRPLSKKLQECGMHGEGIVDESVWFVKTHFPERHGWKPFKAQKAILVVRNPWDAIDSYFNMTLTNSHRTSLAEDQYERFADRWDEFVHNEIHVWIKFYRYWTRKQSIPIMVIRYEDLIVHRYETLRRILLFITGLKSLEGTIYKEQLQQLSKSDKNGPYKPRSGKIAASFRHYSPKQFQYILQVASKELKGFGYDPETQGFPDQIPLPRRQVKPASQPDDDNACVIVNGSNYQIRTTGDTCGRVSSRYRRMLTEPVIASDGSQLNMHEVIFARSIMN